MHLCVCVLSPAYLSACYPGSSAILLPVRQLLRWSFHVCHGVRQQPDLLRYLLVPSPHEPEYHASPARRISIPDFCQYHLFSLLIQPLSVLLPLLLLSPGCLPFSAGSGWYLPVPERFSAAAPDRCYLHVPWWSHRSYVWSYPRMSGEHISVCCHGL